MEDNLNMCEGLLKRLVYEGKIDKESYSYQYIYIKTECNNKNVNFFDYY